MLPDATSSLTPIPRRTLVGASSSPVGGGGGGLEAFRGSPHASLLRQHTMMSASSFSSSTSPHYASGSSSDRNDYLDVFPAMVSSGGRCGAVGSDGGVAAVADNNTPLATEAGATTSAGTSCAGGSMSTVSATAEGRQSGVDSIACGREEVLPSSSSSDEGAAILRSEGISVGTGGGGPCVYSSATLQHPQHQRQQPRQQRLDDSSAAAATTTTSPFDRYFMHYLTRQVDDWVDAWRARKRREEGESKK